MSDLHRILLGVDASVNLLLGVALLSFPAGTLEFLGLPPTGTYFYATLLGGVILGIGIALCVELWGAARGIRGLGLGGAIAINIPGAGVVLVWLLMGGLELSSRGRAILWVVVVVVLGLAAVEIVATRREASHVHTDGRD
jgi:hypothetical protein